MRPGRTQTLVSKHPRADERSNARFLDAEGDGAHWYKPALLLLTIAIVPLFYISVWTGLTALLAAYALTAKLANNDFDRQSRRRTKASHHQPRR